MKLAFLCGASALLWATCAQANDLCDEPELAPMPVQGQLSGVAENDAWNGGDDRHYSSGLQITAMFDLDTPIDPCIQGVLNWITPSAHRQAWGFTASFTNKIITPEDLTRVPPDPADRAYAGITGLTFGAFTFNGDLNEGRRAGEDIAFDEVSFMIGTSGEAARSDDLQSWWHESKLHIARAAGWEHQIDDEWLWQFTYQHTGGFERYLPGEDDEGFDFYWSYGFGAGNLYTYAHAGVGARFGFNMRNDYGPLRITPGFYGAGYWHHNNEHEDGEDDPYFGGYLFVGVDQRYVAFDRTLEAAPNAIDRYDWVADVQWGWVAHLGAARISGTYIERQEEFRGQREPERFASFSVTLTSICPMDYLPFDHNLRRRQLF